MTVYIVKYHTKHYIQDHTKHYIQDHTNESDHYEEFNKIEIYTFLTLDAAKKFFGIACRRIEIRFSSKMSYNDNSLTLDLGFMVKNLGILESDFPITKELGKIFEAEIFNGDKCLQENYLWNSTLDETCAEACQSGNLNRVKHLVETTNFDINASINNDPDDGYGIETTILKIACKYGHLDIVNYLLEIEDINIHIDNDENINALQLACYHGHVKVVERLLQTDIDESLSETDGMNAFHHLLRNPTIEHVKIAELLLQTNIDIHEYDCEDKSILYYAIGNNSHELVQLLLKTDISVTKDDFEYACEKGNEEIVKSLLVSNKFDITTTKLVDNKIVKKCLKELGETKHVLKTKCSDTSNIVFEYMY